MVSFALHGIGVSGGIAIGRAQLVSHATLEVAHYTIPLAQVAGGDRALRRRHRTKCSASSKGCTRALTSGDAPGEFGAFLDVHWMILNDPTLSEAPRADHRRAALQRRVGAHAADGRAGRAVRADRGSVPARAQGRRRAGGRARAEAADGQAGHAADAASAEEQTILVAHDLSPADVIQFKQHHFAAFLTDLGGVDVAHGDRRAQPQRAGGRRDAQRAAADPRRRDADRRRQQPRRHRQSRSRGARRVPAEAERARARAAEAAAAAQQARRHARRHARRAATPTSSCPTTSTQALEERRRPASASSAREFLFLNRDGLPSEDEQFEAYREVAEGMQGRPVTIRTFDLGADKQQGGPRRACRASRPIRRWDLRAVRFCLAEPRLFLTQLRAILRASHYGNVRILVPMLASVGGDRPDAGDDRAGEGKPARAGRAVQSRTSRSAA